MSKKMFACSAFFIFSMGFLADAWGIRIVRPGCREPVVQWVLPGNDHKDIPLDSKVLVYIKNFFSCDNGVQRFPFTLKKSGYVFTTDVKIQHWRLSGGNIADGILVATPDQPLKPGIKYAIEMGSFGEATFTTGAKMAQPLTKAPEISRLEVFFDKNAKNDMVTHRYEADVKAYTEWGAVFYRLGAPGQDKNPSGSFLLQPGYEMTQPNTGTFTNVEQKEPQKCVIVMQINAAGKPGPEVRKCTSPKGAELTPPVTPPAAGCGCQLTNAQEKGPLATLFFLTALFLLALRLRRRV